MTVTNSILLDAYAEIAQQSYDEPAGSLTTPDVPAGSFGTYVEMTAPLGVPIIDGPLGFQARAFFNSARNELVIAFAGTEGVPENPAEFLPDFIADFGLAVAGVSPQDVAAQAFIDAAIVAGQIEAGPFGSFDVTYVGHSLGGFLAQTASAGKTEGEVVVFNSPGAGGFLGLPNGGTFPEENYTYIYSDPAEWGPLGGAIHSIGTPLSDNIYFVPDAEGHALSIPDGTPNTALGDVLDNNTVLVAAGDEIFLPIDEAFQILGATSLLEFFDDGSEPIIEGTAANDTLNGTADADMIFGLGGDDMLSGGAGDDFFFGGSGNDILSGQGGADWLDGGDGDDFLNGGWGWDELIGGSGADRFYHHGVQTGFGTEWIQDFNNAENDRLVTGASGTASDFVVTFATTSGRGSDSVSEAFIRYTPTGQVAWILQDGADLDQIMIQTGSGLFDLLA